MISNIKFYAIINNTLNVRDASKLVDFYTKKMGMRLLRKATTPPSSASTVYLGYEEEHLSKQGSVALELVEVGLGAKESRGRSRDGYWKIGIGLPDVRTSTNLLRKNGVSVSDPEQFKDIGFLCHLQDPEGFTMELLQHTFEHNFKPMPIDPQAALGAANPVVGQITLRIKDPQKSLRFYRDLLGMKYLSRQKVEEYQFTLHFVAFTDESCPMPDNLDAVEIREWLYQRPYTTLELQHRHGTEKDEQFVYKAASEGETGWYGITVSCNGVRTAVESLRSNGVLVVEEAKTCSSGSGLEMEATVLDPDGYRVKLVQIKQ